MVSVFRLPSAVSWKVPLVKTAGDPIRNSLAGPARSLVGAFAIAMTIAATARAQAQLRTFHGIITDTAGRPLANAEIRIMELGRVTRSDSIVTS